MFATILIECIGLEKFQSSLGFTTLIHGVSIAIFFPVAGKYKATDRRIESIVGLRGRPRNPCPRVNG